MYNPMSLCLQFSSASAPFGRILEHCVVCSVFRVTLSVHRALNATQEYRDPLLLCQKTLCLVSFKVPTRIELFHCFDEEMASFQQTLSIITLKSKSMHCFLADGVIVVHVQGEM